MSACTKKIPKPVDRNSNFRFFSRMLAAKTIVNKMPVAITRLIRRAMSKSGRLIVFPQLTLKIYNSVIREI
jgi:hypothetical protein